MSNRKKRIWRKGGFDYGYVSRPSQMCGKLEPFSPHWWAQSIVDGTQEIFKTRKECLSWIKSWGDISK